MQLNLEHYTPRPVKAMIKWLLDFFKKPDMEYLELHLTDHCNLNCKGCVHYCPLAPPHYSDIRQHEIDMRRLRQLFRNIHVIRLMGGEPLLHHDPASFITATRVAFPESHLHFVTNGILLPKASTSFWNACRNTNTTIDLTVYPPLAQRVEGLRALCEAERVSLSVTREDTFFAIHNYKGDSDKQKAYEICRSNRFPWPFLKEGRIYNCVVPAQVHYFNRAFGYQIVADRGINIHSWYMFGRWILRQLYRPTETCRWCAYKVVHFPWSVSNKLPADWGAVEN